MSPKKEDRDRNWVIERIERGLKWLSDTSNLGKTEVDGMKDDLEEVKKRAQGDKSLPTKAMRDLTLKEVETVFRITQVTPRNAKIGDSWGLLPFDTINLANPQAFPDFMAFLCESYFLLKLACY